MNWFPYFIFRETQDRNQKKSLETRSNYYSKQPVVIFSLPVAKGLFRKTGFNQENMDEVISSEIKGIKIINTPDLGFYIVAHLVSKMSGLETGSICE